MLRFIVFTIFVIILSSCSEKSKSNLEVFKAAEEGLGQSIGAMSSSNKVIYNAIDDKLNDVRTVERGLVWKPKALIIKNLSAGIITYIDSLAKALKEEAGLKIQNDKMVFHEDDIDAVERLFFVKNKGSELFSKLISLAKK
jgi:GldM N-terminal domain